MARQLVESAVAVFADVYWERSTEFLGIRNNGGQSFRSAESSGDAGRGESGRESRFDCWPVSPSATVAEVVSAIGGGQPGLVGTAAERIDTAPPGGGGPSAGDLAARLRELVDAAWAGTLDG